MKQELISQTTNETRAHLTNSQWQELISQTANETSSNSYLSSWWASCSCCRSGSCWGWCSCCSPWTSACWSTRVCGTASLFATDLYNVKLKTECLYFMWFVLMFNFLRRTHLFSKTFIESFIRVHWQKSFYINFVNTVAWHKMFQRYRPIISKTPANVRTYLSDFILRRI